MPKVVCILQDLAAGQDGSNLNSFDPIGQIHLLLNIKKRNIEKVMTLFTLNNFIVNTKY